MMLREDALQPDGQRSADQYIDSASVVLKVDCDALEVEEL